MEAGSTISASDWAKGIALSILASIVGGASKLAIRKSWLLQHHHEENRRTIQRRPRRRLESASGNDGLLSEECTATTVESTANSTSTMVDRHEYLQDDLLVSDEREVGEQLLTSRNGWSSFCRSDNGADPMTPSWLPLGLRYSGMLGMSVLNPIFCVLAMNFASPSILAPFSGLTLCWVILGSPCANNEQPSSRQILACGLIIAGEVVVALFGDHTNDEGVTMEEVRKSYQKPAFLMYFVGLVAYVALLGYWMKFSPSPVLRRFAWGCCGGSITGAQNFLKDSLTILKASKQYIQPLPSFFYLFVICAAGTAFSGLLILTACMKRYDATFSAASFVGSFVVSASIMAAAHYDTFAQLEGLFNYILYPTGLVMLMMGVYLLVRESSHDDYEDQETVVVRDQNDHDDDSNKESEDAFGYAAVVEDSATREETVV
ncbi:hypothetical protein IV203_011960 [Nitzschia inconspicua]|uniref:Magnesium transporter n=1 Tax=Nitzschia inconspicua TaxID=303405 RepID=A0A9K3PJ97_9STRA|nr:hypothetical protein IV203_011960 [Nitzschia inconspicua]